MGNDTQTKIKIISELIKRAKASTGGKREELMSQIKYNFQMNPKEKCVVTKLRMILVKMRAAFQYFQISAQCKTKSKRKKSMRSSQVSKKTKRMTLMEKQMDKIRNISPTSDTEELPTMSKISYLKYYGLQANVVNIV